MAESTVVKVRSDGVLSIGEDGAFDSAGADVGGKDIYTVAYEAGDLTLDVPAEAVSVFLDRGKLGSTPSLRYGDDQPITFTFSAYLRDVYSTSDATLADLAIFGASGAAASGYVSTLGASAEVQAYMLRYTIEGTDHGDAADHIIVLNHCVLRASITEGDPSTISISGTAYIVRPTYQV